MNAQEQAIKNLLYWAKWTVEETSAQFERSESDPPTWLAELQSACEFAEIEGVEGEAMK